MATEGNEQQSPFSRRGFVAAAIVVALIAVLGITIGIINATRDDPDPDPTVSSPSPTETSAAPTSTPTEDAGGASVCGLAAGPSDSSRLTSAPAVDEWVYQGTSAYPVSSEHGPGTVDDAGGFQYCFQQSPEGALFAASYAVTVGSDPAIAAEFIEYFTAPGPYRDELLAGASGGADEATEDLRLRISGFRLLAYDGSTATVDVAVTATVDGELVTMSAVYPLVWESGDWKISTDSPDAGSVVGIPNLAGYITWGE